MFSSFNIYSVEDINFLIVIFSAFFLGWFLRKSFKIISFLINNIWGITAEQKAKSILINEGYKILEEQITINGTLLENEKKLSYLLKPDFLVRKNNITYIAEVKTGEVATVKNRLTRRQLLEYSVIYKSNKILLVNADKSTVSRIEFI